MRRNAPRVGLLVLLLSLLGSCGGGSPVAGGVGSGGTGASVGVVQVAVTDAPSSTFDHVWITLNDIRFTASASAGPDDSGWLDYPLAVPVTVDLASLNNGSLQTVFQGLSVPAGVYQQVLLVLTGEAAPLTASAKAHGLLFNDQVDYTDAAGSHSVALNIPNPAQGISVGGSFSVVSGQTLSLAFDFDIGDDVVQYSLGGSTAFTLKPMLSSVDLGHAGALSGQIDINTLTSAGAYNVIVKAEVPNAAGTLHQVVRSTSLRSDGSFVLYPVPAGTASTSVDLLIHGRSMATMIIKGVPVTAGTTSANPTPVAGGPIPVTPSGEYSASLASALSPSGAAIELYQSLPDSGDLPYEEIFRYTDPYSGTLDTPIVLPTAPLQFTSYSQGVVPDFTQAAASGSGGFQAIANAPGFATAGISVTPPAGGGGAVISFGPTLPQAAGVSADSISGRITQAAATYDSGYLVLTMGGQIATTYNLAGTLAQNGATGGAYTVTGLAGGSAGAPLAGARYYGYVVVWSSASPGATLHQQSFTGFADLRQGNALGFDLTLASP